MLEYVHISNAKVTVKPTLLLAVKSKKDRRLIKKYLTGDYTFVENTNSTLEIIDYDLCITDISTFRHRKKEFLEIDRQSRSVHLPVILLVPKDRMSKKDQEILEFIDEVIEIPTPINIFNKRVKNLLRNTKNTLKIARQNEKLHIFNRAMNSANVGITISDATKDDNPLIFANTAFRKMTGYSLNEILGKNCRILQQDDRDQKGIEEIRNAVNEGRTGQSILRNYRKDGSLFWNELSVSPIKNEAGEITNYVGIQNDITQLIEIQEQLRDERNLHRLITNNSTDMISRHSPSGTYLYVSPSSKQLLGYDPEDLEGKSAYDFFHPDDLERVKEAHKGIFKKGTSVQVSYRIQTKSGDYKWVETISRFSDETNNDLAMELQSSTRDISRRKQYESELEESIKEKSVLLQEIHHRVKNNLAVISGLLQIQQFNTDNEELCFLLQNSISRIKTMALIHEKLYRSKSLSDLHFGEYIEELVNTIIASHDYMDNIKINLDCDNISLNVNQAVPCALIVNELVNNAIEHAFKGQESGSISVRFKKNNDEIVVSIQDNGIGFPLDLMEKSNSMGMTIIRTLVTQLNAELHIDTDHGTNVHFSFAPKNVKGAHSRFF